MRYRIRTRLTLPRTTLHLVAIMGIFHNRGKQFLPGNNEFHPK